MKLGSDLNASSLHRRILVAPPGPGGGAFVLTCAQLPRLRVLFVLLLVLGAE